MLNKLPMVDTLGLTANNNYGLRGSLSTVTFTLANDGDDVLVFKAATSDVMSDVTNQKFFIVEDGAALRQMTSSDFIYRT